MMMMMMYLMSCVWRTLSLEHDIKLSTLAYFSR